MSIYAPASQRVPASRRGFVDRWQRSGQLVGEEKSPSAARAMIAVRTRVRRYGARTVRAADTLAMLGAPPVDVGGRRKRHLLLCARARERAPYDESGDQCPDQGRNKRGARIGDHVSEDEAPLRVGDVPGAIAGLVDVRR